MTLEKFYIVGVNYKKTEAQIRGLFAINNNQYDNLLTTAKDYGMNELFVLSTCNRTEIYGVADSAEDLIDLLCTETLGDKAKFMESAYIKNGEEAIEHLLNVSAGLDSQILGDYEILGQLKIAVKFSKEKGFMGAFTERLVNEALQTSKKIKTTTQLSGGTVSVSFAAVQYIRNHVQDVANKNILLLGTGKIGKNTCKNLVDYLDTKNITLINRSPEKAILLANELCLKQAPIEDLDKEIKRADIILVATNSQDPVILKSQLEGSSQKLIIDLSIPYNVEASALALYNVEVVNVDELSKLKDETLRLRQAEVPKARCIITEHIQEFKEWLQMRQYVPVLKALKTQLKEINSSALFMPICKVVLVGDNKEEAIQRIVNGMANKVKHSNHRGCQYLEALNEYIAIHTN